MNKYREIVNKVRKEYQLQQVEGEWLEFLSIADSISPKVILEIGAFKGGSAACFGHLADTVISIDEWQGRFDPEKIKKLCEYHYISDNSHAKRTLQKLKSALNGRQVDVLFIDGDHTYKGAKYDFQIYKNYVRKGGIVGLHDIVESKQHKDLSCHVYKLWEELKATYNTQTIIKGEEWGGIGVIRL